VATSPVSLRLQSFHSDFVARLLLCAAAVLLCHQFQWYWLRSVTCYWNVVADGWLGVHLVRTGGDTVMFRGELYRYVVSCTMADVWCGALAFLWDTRRPTADNVTRWIAFGAGLFFFNVARLTFSDLLFAAHLPWNLAHNVVSGVAYWIVWRWIRRDANRRIPQTERA
jgi:hypothetical protein